MKKILLFAFSAILLLNVSVSAQDQAPAKKAKGPTIEGRVDKIATDLNLSATEKASVLALFQKQDVEVKTLKTEVGSDSPDLNAKMKELRKTQSAELKELLGKEKFQTLQKIRAEEKAKQAN